MTYSLEELENEICKLVQNSISNKHHKDELSFDIPKETVRRTKDILHFDMTGYKCIIKANDIRHVNRRHHEDIHYICKIPEIIQSFSKIKKSITKDHRTGASLINLEFYKKYDKDSVKLVKLKIHREKRLELKTIFVEE